MVKLLVEIDEDTNRILNIIKEKYELKNIGKAIEFIVKKYVKNNPEYSKNIK